MSEVLPLPVSVLLRRSHNAKSAQDRHHTVYFAWEVSIRLAAAARPPRERTRLARGSVGAWVSSLTFSDRPLDDPALIETFSLFCSVGQDKQASPQSLPASKLLGALPAYRNRVIGHGSARTPDFYDGAATTLTEGLEAAWREHVFLAEGTKLVFSEGVDLDPQGQRRARLLVLAGESGWVLHPRGTPDIPEDMLPQRLYLKQGDDYRCIHPWALFRQEEFRERIFFFNGIGRRAEVLDYASGDVLRGAQLEEAFPTAEPAIFELFSREREAGDEVPVEDADRFGGYRILGKLGEGGMGVVYLAEQESLGRLVALKMLPSAVAENAVALSRFRREVAALSRSDHPHVVKILSSGEARGVPYYAMEYVEGSDLSRVASALSTHESFDAAVSTASAQLREDRADLFEALPEIQRADPRPMRKRDRFRQLAGALRDAARGLHHLHEAGIVHRDIKPGNLMVTAGDHRVVVMDLGLAMVSDASRSITRDKGQILGTLRYMPPEQLQRSLLHVDHRADVYALGATFYELMTGAPFFDGDTEVRLIEQVLRQEPMPPEKAEPKIPKDLATILRKATEKDAKLRYESAEALAEDVDAYLKGRPISARPPTLWYLLNLSIRRHRAVAGTVAAALLVTIVGTILFMLSLDTARQRAEDASAGERRAREVAEDANAGERRAREAAEAKEQEANREREKAMEQERKAVAERKRARQAERKAVEEEAWAKQKEGEARDAHAEAKKNLETAVAERKRAERKEREAVSAKKRAEAERAAKARALERVRALGLVAASRDNPGTQLGLQLAIEAVKLGDSPEALTRLLEVLHELAPVEAPASETEEGIMADILGGGALLWSARTHIHGVSFSPDGTRILTSSKDKTARLWDLQGEPVHVLSGHGGPVWSAVFAPTGLHIVTASEDGTARLWTAAGKLLRALKGHTAPVYRAVFSPQGDRILTVSGDHTARLWDLEGKALHVLRGHSAPVDGAAFTPAGDRCFTYSRQDGTASLWSLGGKELQRFSVASDQELLHAALSPQGDAVLTVDESGARVWTLHGKLRAELGQQRGGLITAAFSGDGRTILTTEEKEPVARLWDLSGNELAVLRGHTGAIRSAYFSEGGEHILTVSEDKAVRVWDLAGNLVVALRGQEEHVLALAHTVRGNRVVTVNDEGAARLWSLDRKDLLRRAEQRLQTGSIWGQDRRRYAELLGLQFYRVGDKVENLTLRDAVQGDRRFRLSALDATAEQAWLLVMARAITLGGAEATARKSTRLDALPKLRAGGGLDPQKAYAFCAEIGQFFGLIPPRTVTFQTLGDVASWVGDAQGNPIVLTPWSPFCSMCEINERTLVETIAETGARLVVLGGKWNGAGIRESVEEIRDYVASSEHPRFLAVYDGDHVVSDRFGCWSTCEYMVLDPGLTLRYHGSLAHGFVQEDGRITGHNFLQAALEAVRAGRKVQIKTTETSG